MKQSLRINLKENPSCLDPRRSRSMSGSSQLQAMLFEGLMRVEPNGELSCAQASSYEISPDQKTYTFHLRHSLWSDGSPVTAYDFEKTWKNILDPHFTSLDAHVLFAIKNARAAKKGELSLNEVGIYAENAKTLIVKLECPTRNFLPIVASTILFPINQTQDTSFPNWYLEANEHFVCNGPFKLVSWKPHQEMLLEKNTCYHRANKIKLDSIHISMISSGASALHLYASELLDVIGLPLSPLSFELYRELAQKELLEIVQTPGTLVCMFNTKQFPFNNVNMRKAFSYAINRRVLIDTITLLKEHPALGAVPPVLKKNKAKPFFKDNNMREARKHFQKGLEELGITAQNLSGKLTFSFWKHEHGCPLLPQALKQQWLEKLGVEIELEALDLKALHDKGEKGLFSMGCFVFIAMYYDDSIELLDRFKYAHNPRNYARWQNDSFIDLLTQSEQYSSPEERASLLEQAESLLMDEMPFAPIFHWNYALLVQPYVKGLTVSPLGYLCFDRISIEKLSRKS